MLLYQAAPPLVTAELIGDGPATHGRRSASGRAPCEATNSTLSHGKPVRTLTEPPICALREYSALLSWRAQNNPFWSVSIRGTKVTALQPVLTPESCAIDLRFMRYEARFQAAAVRYMSVRPGLGGRAGHGQGRDRPRTGPAGAVMLTARAASWPLTCHFRMPACCRRLPRRRGCAQRLVHQLARKASFIWFVLKGGAAFRRLGGGGATWLRPGLPPCRRRARRGRPRG
jgi:hypothetical protein